MILSGQRHGAARLSAVVLPACGVVRTMPQPPPFVSRSCSGVRLLPICMHALHPQYCLSFGSYNRLYSASANLEHNIWGNFEFAFKSCTKRHTAKRLHAILIVSGKVKSMYIAARLVNLYANVGDITWSRRTFDQIGQKDAYTWNSMIAAYVRSSQFHEGLKCWYEMLLNSEVRPDFYTFSPVLKACGNLFEGRKIHCWVSKLGLEWDVFVAASLVHMYCRFGSIVVAHKIFTEMPVRDTGSWNAMISGFCQNGNAAEALAVLDEMRLEGTKMDCVTIATLLPVCADINDILRGMLIHLYAIKHGLESDVFVSNALINMYAKFGKLGHAQQVFDEMVVRDLVSWNSIIAAYEQNSYPDTAFKLFGEMQSNGIQPDMLTLVSLASSIAQSKDCQSPRSIHAFTLRRCWIIKDVIMGNAVVDMYAKLGMMDSARKVFDGLPLKDVVSWNTMITGYSQNGLASEAIEVFSLMESCDDLKPNQGTWVSVLAAYSYLGALKLGMRAHPRILKSSLHMDVYVTTCLIDLYGKCGELDSALTLFYEFPRKSLALWNAIISCHGIHGHGETSMQLFHSMRDEGVKPDHVTFVSLLSGCSHSGLVDQGEWCFQVMQEEYGIKPSLKHYGCMVDLLGRAGYLGKAYDLIKDMALCPDASIWGALLGACRIHGNVELSKYASERLFEVDPEHVGYYVLLSNIYAKDGIWEGVSEVRSQARDKGLRKTPGWSSIELKNKMEVFYSGNQSHPHCEEIYKELETLNAEMKSIGYTPDYSFVLQDVEEVGKGVYSHESQ